MAKGTAVATTSEPRTTLATRVNTLITSEQARAFIEPFLPKGTDIQRVAASLLLAIKKDETGKLAKCTPESLIQGIGRITQWGAELGTTAYLIPYGDVATPVRDYKFLAELSAACGYPMEGHPVRQGDDFTYEYGLNPVLRHVPRGKKGAPVTHAYVIVRPPRHAQPIFHVMTAEDIEVIRQKYSKQWKTGPLLDWYAVKTTVRQAVKLLPKDPKLAQLLQAVQEDEITDAEIEELPPETPSAAEAGQAADGDYLDDSDLDDSRF